MDDSTGGDGDVWVAGQVVRMKAREPFAGIFMAFIHCVGDTYLHTISPHTGAQAWLEKDDYRIIEVVQTCCPRPVGE